MAKQKESIEELVARAVVAAQPAKRPFFSAKSPGMWASFGALVVYAFTIFGNINGCFQTKYTKDQKIEHAYNGVNRLDVGDSIMLALVNRNYWIGYGWHKQDSTQSAQLRMEMLDSLSDHRFDLNYLNRKYQKPIIFRGQ